MELRLPSGTKCFKVGTTSRLTKLATPTGNDRNISGRLVRIRVVEVNNGAGAKASISKWYAGIIAKLSFDPGRWRWGSKDNLFVYSAKKGRERMRPIQELSRTIPDKWKGILPRSYKPDWRDVWHNAKPQKEAGFLWSVYHHAIAVNEWRHQMCPQTDRNCPSCILRVPESIKHRFVDCPKATHAWSYAQTVFNLVMEVPKLNGKWDPLVWQQCLLGSPLPRKLRKGKKLWMVLRGSVVWLIWLDRNADVFSDTKWTASLREIRIWEATIDVIRTAWARTLHLIDA